MSIPEVCARPECYYCIGDSFPILNGCSAHHADCIEELAVDNEVILMKLRRHLSSQFQCLNLLVLAVTKRLPARAGRFGSRSMQSQHTSVVVSSFPDAAAPQNIAKSFRSTGISLEQQLAQSCGRNVHDAPCPI
jgi:hypothetical protein